MKKMVKRGVAKVVENIPVVVPKGEKKNEIVVYQPDAVVRLEVRILDESVWLTQAQIAELFGTKRPAITKHLANIYKCGELEKEGTCSILEHMGHDGAQQYRTAYYNLDAILAVGYRVNSREATQYPKLDVLFSENFHDRFLILDDAEIYLIGASLKDLGRKCFAFTKLDASEIAGLKGRV